MSNETVLNENPARGRSLLVEPFPLHPVDSSGTMYETPNEEWIVTGSVVDHRWTVARQDGNFQPVVVDSLHEAVMAIKAYLSER